MSASDLVLKFEEAKNLLEKMSVTKLVIGLGNPGSKYQNTRHNTGFLVLDALAAQVAPHLVWRNESRLSALVIKKDSLILAKPAVLMNCSGWTAKKLVNFYKIDLGNLWLVYDDLDIKLGEYKIVRAKPPKTHNGAWSVINALGSADFWHIRVGIEDRAKWPETKAAGLKKEKRVAGEQYVLESFDEKELKIINKVADEVVAEVSSDLT